MKKHILSLVFTIAFSAPALAVTVLPGVPMDPVALYTFENGVVTDDSGNGNTGTDLGGVSLSVGGGFDGGTAGRFTNVPGRSGIDTGIDINRGVMPSLTMGAWVYLDRTATGLPKFLSHDDGGYDRTVGVDTRGDDVGGGFAAFTGSFVADGPGTAPTDTWVHVAVVYDGPSSGLFINGTLAESFTDSSATFDSRFDLHIGGNPGYSEDWVGLLDDVFIYDRALTTDEITSIYRNGFSSTAVPLPATGLLLIGALGAIGARRRKRG